MSINLMRYYFIKFLCFVSLSFLLVTPLLAKEKIKKTGTFSNLEYNSEGGDLLGVELRIVYTKYGYQGVLQIAEGGPEKLMLVDIKFEGNKLQFKIPPPYIYSGMFSGEISSKKITGSLKFTNGGVWPVTLLRGKSYWD